MIQVARISLFVIVLLRWLARGQSVLPGALLSTHNDLNATTPNWASESCLSEEHMSDYDRQNFRCTYSRDLSISCQPILLRGKRMTRTYMGRLRRDGFVEVDYHDGSHTHITKCIHSVLCYSSRFWEQLKVRTRTSVGLLDHFCE